MMMGCIPPGGGGGGVNKSKFSIVRMGDSYNIADINKFINTTYYIGN